MILVTIFTLASPHLTFPSLSSTPSSSPLTLLHHEAVHMTHQPRLFLGNRDIEVLDWGEVIQGQLSRGQWVVFLLPLRGWLSVGCKEEGERG